MKNVIFFLLFTIAQLSPAQRADELKQAFREHIEIENAGSSVAMVEVSAKGTRFINYGKLRKDSTSPNADEKTIYEIGSITKVFTGILLAEAIKRGEVKLDDPISKHLPKAVKVPVFDGKEITLVDLATHSSGLPRLPVNFSPKDPLNPYADYSAQNAYDFLSDYKLTREIGKTYEYSNFGVGLLGHILSLKAKLSYEQLVSSRILKPLKMNDTSLNLPAAKKPRHAQGLNEKNDPTSNWYWDSLAGAGALRTTTTDMAKFISANLGLTKTSLSQSLIEARKMLRKGEHEAIQIGLCWFNAKLFETEVFWHGGGTYGFASYIAIAPSLKKGYFLVRNWGGENGSEFLESVAFNSINSRIPIKPPTPAKKEIILSEEVLDKYVGEYEITPTFSVKVFRDGKRLFTQATGQQPFEMFAEKEDEFFLKELKASLSFTKDASGRINGAVLKQSGQSIPARKVK